MKLLFDYLPLIFFFTVFKLAGHSPEAAQALADGYFASLVSGGKVDPGQAPILLATIATMLVTALQIVYLLARRQRIDTMLWVTAGIVAIFGGATIYFHNEAFIKWKPTVLYWIFAVALLVSDLVFQRNLTRLAIDKIFAAPDALWRRLNLQWVAFFAALGFLNLYVAFNYPTDTWVTFKLFGATGLTFLVFILQGIPLMKYMRETDS